VGKCSRSIMAICVSVFNLIFSSLTLTVRLHACACASFVDPCASHEDNLLDLRELTTILEVGT
jgi:hypothetical protein